MSSFINKGNQYWFSGRAAGADESVMEKPETLANTDLGAVRSSKARRLKRIRPGYFNPPGGKPVCVPGLEWLALLLAGPSGAPCLYQFEWWTRRSEHAR